MSLSETFSKDRGDMIDLRDAAVWVSRAPMDTTRIKGFTSDLLIADRKRTIDAMRRNEAGEALPPERFPKEIFTDLGEKIAAPDLAHAGGFWTVSAAVADVLRSVDLGGRRSTRRRRSATT